MSRQSNNTPPPGTFMLNTASPQARGLAAWYPALGAQSPLALRDFSNIGPSLAPTNSPAITGDARLGWATNLVGASSQSFSSSTLPVTSPPFSFSAWVKFGPGGATQEGFVFAVSSSSRDSYFALGTYNPGGNPQLLAVTRKASTYFYAAVANGLSLDVWYHAIAVFESASLRKIYLNGNLFATDGNTAPGMPAMDASYIGSGFISGGGKLDAGVADVRVYSRAIGPSEAYNLCAKPWDLYKTVKRPPRGWKPSTLKAATRKRRTLTAPPAGWHAIRRESSQAKGLQASWRFDEPGGATAFSRVAPGRDLTLQGSATRGISQQFPSYLKLTAASSDFASLATPPVATYPLTMACWVRSQPTSGNAILMCITNGTGVVTMIQMASGTPIAWSLNGTATAATATTTPSPSVWTHVAAVWASSSSRKIYVSGVLEATDTTTKDGLAGVTKFQMGKYLDAVPLYNTCDIAEPRIYNRIVSDDEIRQMATPLHWDLYATLMSRRKVVPIDGSETAGTFRFRRTFSCLGTRTGSRQVFQ